MAKWTGAAGSKLVFNATETSPNIHDTQAVEDEK
jgi:hypothetical protein